MNLTKEHITEIFSKIKNKFKKKTAITEKPLNKVFFDLAPIDEIDKGEVYFEALDSALTNKTVKNIAISGPYAAGKSSIINSYLKKNPEIAKHTIKISLAKFELEAKSDGKAVKEFKTDEIERAFLAQLFYQVKHRDIPQSRFRKLHRVNTLTIFFCIVGLTLLVAIGNVLFNHMGVLRIHDAFIRHHYRYNLSPAIRYLLLAVLYVASVGITSLLIKRFFSKFKNIEISFFDKAKASTGTDDDTSVFDKNMDEIVYFFEETGYQYVFIEDLDRFCNREIFIKLREINTILNNYKEVNKKEKTIKFIYAVRDDFFSCAQDRNKFFEYILPVVPYINNTNSSDKFKEKKEKLNACEISDSYILKVSSYISDMRILNEILNEFVIYKHTIDPDNKLELKDEQQMSLIIFKNLYPAEFSKVATGEGILNDVFNEKTSFVEREVSNLKQERTELNKKLSTKESPYNNKETKILALFDKYKKLDAGMTFTIDEKKYSLEEVLAENVDITQLFDESDADNIWMRKKEELKAQNKKERNDYQKRLNYIEKRIKDINEWNLKNILAYYDKNMVFTKKEVLENDLLIFLVRNGYIDEHYSNYINYFYPENISDEEFRFIQNIRNYGNTQDYEKNKIVNFDNVINRIDTQEFEQDQVLNFGLVEHMLIHYSSSEKTKRMLKHLASGEEYTNQFICRCLIYCKHIDVILVDLSAENPKIWLEIDNDEEIEKAVKNYLFKNLMEIVNNDLLERINKESNILTELYNSGRIVDIINELVPNSYDKVIKLMQRLKLMLDVQAISNIQYKAFKNIIIENNLYKKDDNTINYLVDYLYDLNVLSVYEQLESNDIIKHKNRIFMNLITDNNQNVSWDILYRYWKRNKKDDLFKKSLLDNLGKLTQMLNSNKKCCNNFSAEFKCDVLECTQNEKEFVALIRVFKIILPLNKIKSFSVTGHEKLIKEGFVPYTRYYYDELAKVDMKLQLLFVEKNINRIIKSLNVNEGEGWEEAVFPIEEIRKSQAIKEENKKKFFAAYDRKHIEASPVVTHSIIEVDDEPVTSNLTNK